jgi:GT2 family glycosyltransferase
MHVAVSIVGFRNVSDIVACLAALEAGAHADFEVVVCENGGPAAYAALAAAVPSRLRGGQAVTLVEAPGNLGYAGGVNVCLAAAPGADAWWVLNPDTRPEPDALAAAVARLAAGDCDAAGSLLYRPNGTVQAYGYRWRSWLARAVSLGIGRRLEDPVDASAVERAQTFLNGAAMLVGRRFLEAVGPMREDYFLYCEEVEWCLRGLARGMRLGFAPASLVLHEQGTTTGTGGRPAEAPRTPTYLNERNRILLTRDCFPGRAPLVSVAALVLLLLRCMRHGAWRQLGYGLEGWWAGVRGERGRPRWIPA